MSKKIARFVFPKKDLIDPSWVVNTIPPFVALQHLLNISWDRLSEGEMKVWDNMCGRRVREKEVSQLGLYKTSYDLRKDRGDYKRECQKINYIDQNKKVKNTILKQLMLSNNITLKSSNDEVSQKNLSKLFKTDKEAISTYITDCLNFKFSRSTQKVLKLFSTKLLCCTSSQSKFFLRRLALCLWAIRAQANRLESQHSLAAMQISKVGCCLLPGGSSYGGRRRHTSLNLCRFWLTQAVRSI